jgi:hypothetical protein
MNPLSPQMGHFSQLGLERFRLIDQIAQETTTIVRIGWRCEIGQEVIQQVICAKKSRIC